MFSYAANTSMRRNMKAKKERRKKYNFDVFGMVDDW